MDAGLSTNTNANLIAWDYKWIKGNILTQLPWFNIKSMTDMKELSQ